MYKRGIEMISSWKIRITWLAYIPVALILAYTITVQFTPEVFFSLDYSLMLLLAIVVALFPIRTEETVFSLISGVSLAAFVMYGLIPEIFLSTLALIAVIIRSDIKLDQHYRYPLNLLMTTFLSILSAGAYYLTQNVLLGWGLSGYGILPVLAYMFIHVIINQFFVYVTGKYYYRRDNEIFFNEHLIFSFKTTFSVIPLSFILFYLYFEMGVLGILIGALPFLMVTIGLNYFHVVRSNNNYLTKVNKASQKLSAKLSQKAVLKTYIKSLLKIFPGERLFYFKVVDGEQVILKYEINEDLSIKERNIERVLNNRSILAKALNTQSIATYSRAADWDPLFSFDIDYPAESAVVLPVHILTQNKGIILLLHSKRSIFDEYIVSLIEVFHQYFITVLDNANHYEKLERSNVTDYLTNLPNFRGFSKELKILDKKADFESLSIVVLDLDYFKAVNDTHGHEAGNDVLRQVATVLKTFKNKDRYIARYGGEEFIILLKNHGKETTQIFAEKVRQAISTKNCRVSYSIVTEQSANLTVTASLGTATYPDDTNDVFELISLADRVMYTGSKKSGRNRVTAFSREG